jgi:hypothetical protein
MMELVRSRNNTNITKCIPFILNTIKTHFFYVQHFLKENIKNTKK